MLSGDDLSTQYFVAAAAISVLGIAMTQAGWTHRLFVRSMFALGGLLAVSAFFWKPLTKAFPRVSEVANPIGGSSQAWFTLVGCGLGVLFWLDYRARVGSKNLHDTQRYGSDNTALANEMQGLFERVGKIENLPIPASAEDHRNLVTTVVNLTTDTNARIDRLTANPQADLDILILMHYAIYQSAALLLDYLLSAAPDGIFDGPLQLGGDFAQKNAECKEFIDLARRKIEPNTHRRQSFEGLMHGAENEAERRLEETPIEQRPKGVDQLLVRKWAITHLQCARAIEFLKHERKEIQENLLNQRSRLLERYSERNPS